MGVQNEKKELMTESSGTRPDWLLKDSSNNSELSMIRLSVLLWGWSLFMSWWHCLCFQILNHVQCVHRNFGVFFTYLLYPLYK